MDNLVDNEELLHKLRMASLFPESTTTMRINKILQIIQEFIEDNGLNDLKKENEELKLCINKWQEHSHPKEKHILSFEKTLTEEQYIRLRKQCDENFGPGNSFILEGGIKYLGTTKQFDETK